MRASPRATYGWAVRHDRASAAGLYATVVAVYFSPLIKNIGSSVMFLFPYVSFSSTDSFHFLWNYWWVSRSLFTSHGIYYTNLFFHPQGASLVLQTLDVTDALLSAPIRAVAGLVAGYNAILLVSFFVAAFGMYLYMRPYAGNGGALVAGLVFGFFPQHVAQAIAGHPNLSSVEWFPLLMLCLRNSEKKRVYAVGAGVFIALIAYTDLELLVMAALLLGVYVAYKLADGGLGGVRRWGVPLGASLGVSALLTLPYLLAAVGQASARALAGYYAYTVANSAAPLMYLVPSPFSQFLAQPFLGFYSGLEGAPSQWPISIGWTVLFLSVCGVVLARGRLRMFFASVAALGFFLSLGPAFGSASAPYDLVFRTVHALEIFRTPARFSIEVMFALSALAGIGTLALVSSVGRRWGVRARQVASVAVVCLILFEYYPAVTVESTQFPAWVHMIAEDQGKFSVLVLPAGKTPIEKALYYQTAFDKPLVDGKVSQLVPTLPDYATSVPYLAQLAFPNLKGVQKDVFQQPFSYVNMSALVLSRYGIRYVVLFSAFYRPSEYTLVNQLLRGTLGNPVYASFEYMVYRLNQTVTPQAFAEEHGVTSVVLPLEGWGPPSGGGRNVSQTSSLTAYSTQSVDYSLTLGTGTPFLRWCVSSGNGTFAEACAVSGPTGLATFPRLRLADGWNVLSLSINASSTEVSEVQLQEA